MATWECKASDGDNMEVEWYNYETDPILVSNDVPCTAPKTHYTTFALAHPT